MHQCSTNAFKRAFAIIARGDNYYAEVCDGQNESPNFASTKEGTSNEEESLSSPTEDTMEFSKGDCKDGTKSPYRRT